MSCLVLYPNTKDSAKFPQMGKAEEQNYLHCRIYKVLGIGGSRYFGKMELETNFWTLTTAVLQLMVGMSGSFKTVHNVGTLMFRPPAFSHL